MFVIQLAIGKDDLGFIDNTQSTMIFESSTINCTSHTARRLVRHGPKAGLITLANTPRSLIIATTYVQTGFELCEERRRQPFGEDIHILRLSQYMQDR